MTASGEHGGGPGRALLVPEVLQSSALDCGPAALAALLAGFGMEASFEGLREACGTGRDGTSIDAIEAVAIERGLDAEQVLVPVDHLALPEAGCLPCVLVVRQAGGASHFVVVWRRHGRRAQVMDPAGGRRWPTLAALEREIYRHRAVVPAAAWRAWACSADLLDPLGGRLAALGLGATERRVLVTGVAQSGGGSGSCGGDGESWGGAAALDAAVRFTGQLVAAGGVRRGRDAGRILSGLLERLARQDAGDTGGETGGGGAGGGSAGGGGAGGGGASAVPASCWSVRPAAPGAAGEQRVTVEGAVMVRVRGRRGQRSADAAPIDRARRHVGGRREVAGGTAGEAGSEGASEAGGEAAGEAARTEQPERRGGGGREPESADRRLGGGGSGGGEDAAAASSHGGLPRLPSAAPGWIALGLAALGGGVGRLAEVALFAACLELLPALGSRPGRLALLGSLLCLAAALLLFELAGARTALALGRRVETVLRLRLAAKLPRLPDRYLRTRLAADLAERAHLLARVQRGPELAAAALRGGIDAALAAAGIAWLDPGLAAGSLAAGAAAVLVPLALLPRLEERSRRASAHAAAVGGFYLDALRGLAAVHAHQAAPALRRRHDELLAGWLRARRTAIATAGWLEAAMQAILCAAAAGLVLSHVRRHGLDPQTLVLTLWAAQLLGGGQRLAVIAGRDLPLHRSLMRRIEEPLAAGEEPAGVERPADSGERRDGVAIGFAGLAIEIGGRALLHHLDLEIPAGQHVAILGRSGAGKSTLLGALLGWHRPAAGAVLADGRPLDPRGLAKLRRATAWVAPEVTLWSTPVLDNLCYGLDAGGSRSGAADGMTPAEALRAAQLLDLLQELPHGLQTPVGEAGGRLSGGEGQRLRLARALLRPGIRLALLDEAMRGLGADQRRELLAEARRRWRRATLLCVTHSPAEAAGFDRLLILDGGRVVEDGLPGLLAVRRGSRYRALLDAEEQVTAALAAPGWRRLRLAGGRLHEREREAPTRTHGGGEGAAATMVRGAPAVAGRAWAVPAEIRR